MVLLPVLAGGWFIHGCGRAREEKIQIRARYQQMVSALSSGDTDSMIGLIAPDNRPTASAFLGVLTNFTKPLGPKSSVSSSQSEARVCPERIFYFGVLPGGHTIDMIRSMGSGFLLEESTLINETRG
jgi:hypothetical protein